MNDFIKNLKPWHILVIIALGIGGAVMIGEEMGVLEKTEYTPQAKTPSPKKGRSCNTSKSIAYVALKDHVKANIKSPSSARFPSIADADLVCIGDSVVTCGAWVESKNSFNATIRTRWAGRIHFTGKESHYLENFAFLE